MNATLAALLGAVIGGLLSVLASWLAQRIQSQSQIMSQEIRRRQRLYGEFVQSAARSYADALQEHDPDPGELAKLYGGIGRMKLYSSDGVIHEADRIIHEILQTYGGTNRSRNEIREMLAKDSIDLFSGFGNACRKELRLLRPRAASELALS